MSKKRLSIFAVDDDPADLQLTAFENHNCLFETNASPRNCSIEICIAASLPGDLGIINGVRILDVPMDNGGCSCSRTNPSNPCNTKQLRLSCSRAPIYSRLFSILTPTPELL